MQKAPQRKISLFQIAYTSEWALAKLFPVMFENGLEDYFTLAGICGREPDPESVRDRLLSEIEKRSVALHAGKTWRMENTLNEIKSAVNILGSLARNGMDYHCVSSGQLQLPRGSYDAGAIFSSNPTHLQYIIKLLEEGKHVLCEKPLVSVTDMNHLADRADLDKLEALVQKHKGSLVMMDSEHYSAKKASRAFFENFGEMIASYGRISKIQGHTNEKDDPSKERTRTILSRQNRTGLLLDMGCHLFGLIANIKGEIGDIAHAKYGMYPGYDVETYASTKFGIRGNLFYDDAEGEFTFAKFIDRFREPRVSEDKKVEISFEDRRKGKTISTTCVTIDFSRGTVTDSKGREWHTEASNNEYVNILTDFYNAIIRNQQPRTNFEHSIKSLDAIHRVYQTFPVMKNLVGVYKP